jgi:hypothetical protein
MATNRCSTRLFTWDKDANRFITEASDLAANGVDFGPVFDDAVDEGLIITSHRTGAEAKFYISYTVDGDHGEVVSWVLKPTNDTVRKMSWMADVDVVVLND